MAALTDSTRRALRFLAFEAGVSEPEMLDRLIWYHVAKVVGSPDEGGEGE